MKERKFIVDTTLRDGEQSPHVSFDRAQKLRIFSLLEQAGVPQIEAGVPASSTYEKETILEMKKIQRRAKISVWSRLHLEDVRHCIDCEPDIIHLSIPVSYMHIYTKLKKNKAWVVGQLYACIGLLQTCGAEISAGFEDASRADMSFVIAITRILSDFNVKRIRLADTVGVMLPSTCRETVETFFAYVDKGTQLGFHAHNDFGMALANTVEMLKSGCLWADTSLCGIGERAGNCDFYDLIRVTNHLFDFGITPEAAAAAQRAFRDILGEISP